jgi:hypothetical protein
MYSDNQAKIKLDQEGPAFTLLTGIKQGDPQSPKLFTCLLEQTFRQMDWHNWGIDIDGRKLLNLRSADDIILFAKSAKELQIMLEQLRNRCTKAGLLINSCKTKIITNSKEIPIKVGQETISYKEDYTECFMTLGHNCRR